MFFTREKLANRVAELGQKKYFGATCIAPFTSMKGILGKDEHYTSIPEEIVGEKFGLNDMFTGYDEYLWLQKEVTLLEAKEGCEVVGLFDFGLTGSGNNSGFESLLYVDGHPYQGVDTNHNEVVFHKLQGKEVTLTFLLWTGLERNGAPIPYYHQCKRAHLAYLHKKTDVLYYLGRMILLSLDMMDKSSEHYDNLLTALDRALLLVDWAGEDFYETVEEAYEKLLSELSVMEKHTDVTVDTIGHTHIDVAWRWRLKHTREKAQRSFSTVLHLMDMYDDYIFLQSQPQLYQYIKEDCPELYEKIKKKIEEGKWEVDGGMWVEADCNLTSGESLVRQLLYGTRFIEKEFGKKCEYLWLPDVFGYSWALPQILKLCEIDTFMTTKISWNQYNEIPNDLFQWRGIDGTEILTYFISAPAMRIDDHHSTYGADLFPHNVIGCWKRFKNKNLTKHTLNAYGFGDGGGGVTRSMLERRRAMDMIPGIPHVKTQKAGEFFKQIHQDVKNTDQYVPVWDGELYLEFHRGTYTTQSYNKKMNRYLEQHLAQTEWLESVAYANRGTYEMENLHKAWECVLLHQFHDIIPGSSIREVYEDSKVNYDRAIRLISDAKQSAWSMLLESKVNTYSVYATNSFAGKEIVHISKDESGYFIDKNGVVLESQRKEKGYDVLVEAKAFTFVPFTFIPKENVEDVVGVERFYYGGNQLETPYYSICWNENGQLTKIYDKEACRNVLREEQEGNVLEIYEDKPLNYEAWDIDIFYTEKLTKLHVCQSPELVENGKLKAVVRFKWNYHKSTIVQDMVVYAHTRRIDFKTYVEWYETNKLLKAAFYTDIRSTKATYDIQFGHVERPTHWNTSWDWAKFEVCAHKWADLSETGYGVSLLNDSKYGYSIKDNGMKLSLLRAPKAPDYKADMGEHEFTYSLYPHEGTFIDGDTIGEANRLNMPAQVVEGIVDEPRKLVKVQGTQVQIDAVKKAEDEECLIVRLHECTGSRGKVVLSSDYPLKQMVPCNLLEHDMGEAVVGNELTFDIKPFEIKTYKCYLS